MIIILPLLCSLFSYSSSQWVWLKGKKGTGDDFGDFGSIGVPSVTNTPNSLAEMSGLTIGGVFIIFYDNLWMFNMTDETWTFVWGSVIGDQAAVYGTRGEYNDIVKPGSRRSSYMSYDVKKDSLLVYGGYANVGGYYATLMEYSFNLKQWRWVMGNTTNDSPAVYGIKGIEDVRNTPGARSYGQYFTDDDSGCFYINGGIEIDGIIAEMWRYNLTSGFWIWLSGSTVRNVDSNYNSVNPSPGGLMASAFTYSSVNKKLYVFGGSLTYDQSLDDLWEYDLTSFSWTRLTGSSVLDSSGVYGPIGKPSASYLPRSRSYGVMTIDEANKVLYLFGGQYFIARNFFLSDFWRFNLSSAEWTLLSGSSASNAAGDYGIKGTVSTSNYPPARSSITGFYSISSQKFYVFGGLNSVNPFRVFSDTWAWIRPVADISTANLLTASRVIRRVTNSNQIGDALPLTVVVIIIVSVIVSLTAVISLVLCVKRYKTYHRYMSQLRSKSHLSSSYSRSKTSLARKPFSSSTNNTKNSSRNQSSQYSAEQSSTQFSAYQTQSATLVEKFHGLAIPAHLCVRKTDFRLETKIGSGGGGDVYLAKSLSNELSESHKLAAKVVSSNSQVTQQNFFQEISIMFLLKDCKNIAKLVAYCNDPLTMLLRYCPEGSLYDFIKHLNRRKRLRTFLIKDIACGLFELHSRNLAHCDIKPQNVLIDRINGRPTAVLTDFGITHILTEELLQVKAFEIANLRGLSVGYAAPETFTRYRLKSKASAAIVKAGDIYSFSCVVYFLVRRRSPWNS